MEASEIAFEHGPMRQDGPIRLPFWDILLRMVSDFQIRAGDRIVFSEPKEFPVVELAVALEHWLEAPSGSVFSFDPTDYELSGVIEFRPERRGQILVQGNDLDAHLVPSDELNRAARQFIESVAAGLRDRGVEWHEFLASEPRLDE